MKRVRQLIPVIGFGVLMMGAVPSHAEALRFALRYGHGRLVPVEAENERQRYFQKASRDDQGEVGRKDDLLLLA